jgi:hypothetical protein
MARGKKQGGGKEKLLEKNEKEEHELQESAHKKEIVSAEKKPGSGFGKILENRLFPVLLSIVFIAIIAAGVLLIFSMNAPQQLSVLLDFKHADTSQKHIAKFMILYSQDCAGCEEDNSFIALLEENRIAYMKEKIEIGSEDGKKLVSIIMPKRVPLVILDGKSLDSTMKIKTKGGFDSLKNVLDDYYVRIEKIVKWNDSYLIPEIAFDERGHVEMLLDVNSCGSNDKIRVDLYTDPYCAPCALSTVSLEENKELFGNKIDFNYNFFPLDSKKMLYTWEKISPFANYSICASRQGKLREFQAPVYKYYCAPDQNVLDYNGLERCSESPNFHRPIPADILSEAMDFARIDKTQLGSCLEQVEKDKPLMVSTASAYGINEVPHVVLNCKFITHADNMKNGVCAVNPKIPECNFAIIPPQ